MVADEYCMGSLYTFFLLFSMHRVLIFPPFTNVCLFFNSPPLLPLPRVTDTHVPTSSYPLSIWSSLLTFSSYRAISSSIMWGSMRQKESWVMLGPISLASHLSFSSIILTGPFDRAVGNHHPCICCCISPRVSFNSLENMQNKKTTQCPDSTSPSSPVLRHSFILYARVFACCLSIVSSVLQVGMLANCIFCEQLLTRNALGGQVLVLVPSQI